MAKSSTFFATACFVCYFGLLTVNYWILSAYGEFPSNELFSKAVTAIQAGAVESNGVNSRSIESSPTVSAPTYILPLDASSPNPNALPPLVVPMYQTPQTPISNFQSTNRAVFGTAASGGGYYGGLYFQSQRRESSSLDELNPDGETMHTIVNPRVATAQSAHSLTESKYCTNCQYIK